jgi:hypothetical protein
MGIKPDFRIKIPALFCILTALIGIRYSWISFVIAAAAQLLIMSGFTKKKG